MNTRTKSTNIQTQTKKVVHERDNGCCVLCGRPVYESLANAHIIPRSKGGLGVEENIVTLCPECHHEYDHTLHRKQIYGLLKRYITKFYPEWSEEKMIYKKGQQC